MTARITLALLFIVPAVMAYPWPSAADRWALGVAIVAEVVLFARWRGLFFTTMVGRRLAMWVAATAQKAFITPPRRPPPCRCAWTCQSRLCCRSG